MGKEAKAKAWKKWKEEKKAAAREAALKAKKSWQEIREWLHAKDDDIVVFTSDIRNYKGSMAMAIGNNKAMFIREAAAGRVYDEKMMKTIAKGAFVVIHPWTKTYSFKNPFPWTCFEKEDTMESLKTLEAVQAKNYDEKNNEIVKIVFDGPVHWKESQLAWAYGDLYSGQAAEDEME